jgi:hypothetical protein
MVGRRLIGTSLVAAVLLVGGAAQASAQDGQRLVMVYNSAAEIAGLENQGYDVGYIGDKTEAAVYLTAQEEGLLQAQGFRIGAVVADDEDFAARAAANEQASQAEALAAAVAKNGVSNTGKAKSAVTVPGHVVIQHAYTFTNYAGRFLYVEARNDLHGDTTGPAMSFTYTGPNGTSQVYNMSNSSITPDGGDAAIGGNKLRDTDAGSGAQYMYHRALVALQGANAGLQANQVTVRVADATGNFDQSGVAEWANKTLPARIASYQKDFITKYMDPTEIKTRMDQLTADNPGIMQAIDLPNKTDGYQRQALAMMEGATVAPGSNPSTANNATAAASRARAVQLFSKAVGYLGGNNITAEFKAPAAGR